MESCYSQQRRFLISVFVLNVLIYWGGYWKVSGCFDSERKALTTFRKALNDSFNILSSWDDDASDCCKWRGITCHNITGFVLKLDLHVKDSRLGLGGRIDPALVQLKHLQFLDLSSNAFNGAPIPDFLGSMKELRHLNLSDAGFSGRIPRQLGNLTKLISLKLSSPSLSAKNLWWLTSLPSLTYLDMSFVNLSMASHDWVHVMNMSPSLVELYLWNCGLSYISPTLPSVNFTSVRVLDLSENNFNSSIPNWIANISSLVSLYLSNDNFHGEVPYDQFSKLPNLEELWLGSTDDSLRVDWSEFLEGSWRKLKILDLSFSQLHGGIPNSIGNITSLVDLYLSFGENITGSIPRAITKLINLESLSLYGYKMHAAIPDWLSELENLKHLAFRECMLTGPIPAALLGGLSSLEELDLSWNQLNGNIPAALGGLSSLLYLSLRGNELNGNIPAALGGLSSLEELDLSGNQLNGNIPAALGGLSSLEELDLSGNQLNGNIPAALGGLSSLEELDLSGNQLNGTIPTTLGQLSNLSWLLLSYNSLTGNVSESLFENLKKLTGLTLSSNSLVFYPHSDWAPPFQLSYINLGSCHLGPRFPLWLRTQKYVQNLDLSNTTISGIIPTWFWDLTPQLFELNLSNNQIFGQLPNPFKMQPGAFSIDLSLNNFSGPIPCILNGASFLDLSNNQFSGPIPPNFTSTMQHLNYFSARGNQISGMIPSFIEGINSLTVLDLSRNNIGGIIPLRLGNCIALEALDLSKNRLSGGKSTSLGLLRQLQTMHLSNNNLSGEIPSSLKKCTSLETLDLGHNNFSGHIPTWIGKSFPALRILSLRSNMLTGNIPAQISNLTSLQILDVGQNYLSGSIPQSFEDLMAMKKTNLNLSYGGIGTSYYKENLFLSMKGQMLEYTRTVSLVTCMDLSRNNLSGEIPKGLTNLLGLRVLNFSENHLTGEIPDKIGKLALLESLDFSKNQLSGTIPLSMSNLTFLSYLNLSFNNLWGRIPTGNQLQTLPYPSIYMGNNGLCGSPLPNKCVDDETPQAPMPVGGDLEKDEEEYEMRWFYSAVGPGFAIGFWAFCGVLILKKPWRIAYYRFFDDLENRLCFNCHCT
ncbi:receptor-like protein EIX2 [Magnolia sinica]|uniref:receptor-like protein EIX2 n=1 Tax=Magnolia sinica TaxID=86752 RepID=UPI0026599682|nr:receptor-like protein EIX2 [Magnolia sinica]